MKDSDADEPVAPLKVGTGKKSIFADKLLKASGLVLAAMSAFFPWYVFFNPDKFGIHASHEDRTRDLPNWPARNVNVSPLAMVNKNQLPPQNEVTDPMTTATISNLGREDPNGQPPEEQPFPGKSAFRLLHVANGRALIEDVSGMYLVRVGSILPDNSRLATIEQRDGKWVIVTSKGDIYAKD